MARDRVMELMLASKFNDNPAKFKCEDYKLYYEGSLVGEYGDSVWSAAAPEFMGGASIMIPIKPYGKAEVIKIDFVVTPTGVTFEEGLRNEE